MCPHSTCCALLLTESTTRLLLEGWLDDSASAILTRVLVSSLLERFEEDGQRLLHCTWLRRGLSVVVGARGEHEVESLVLFAACGMEGIMSSSRLVLPKLPQLGNLLWGDKSLCGVQ